MVFGYRSAEAEGIKKCVSGNSLVVQWLRFSTFTVVAWIQSLVRELRSNMPCSEPGEKKSVSERVQAILSPFSQRYIAFESLGEA